MAGPTDEPPSQSPDSQPPAGQAETGGASQPAELDLGSRSDAVDRLFERVASDQGAKVDEVIREADSGASNETGNRAEESTKGYAPRDQAQDSARQIITLWLIGLFSVLIVLSFVALFISGLKSTGGFDQAFFGNLKTLLDVLLGPVITLLSSAIGFYFGYQQGSTSSTKDGERAPSTRSPVNGG